MVICFNCSTATKQQLDLLLQRGEYADYGDAIAAAIANQAVLSEQVWERGALVIPAERGAGAMGGPVPRNGTSTKSGRASAFSRLVGGASSLGIPPLFSRDGLESASPEPPEERERGVNDFEFVLPSQWLWGQFNRILPAKASCRALARLQLENPDGVLLAEAAQAIAKEAADLGDYLVDNDRRLNLKRDEALATAFPRSGPDIWKSQQRYSSQFVGSVNSEGIVSGMLTDLGLLSSFGRKDGVGVRLTQPGWQLARLNNPVLDSTPLQTGTRLSDEEIDFLTVHVHRSVRAEDSAYRFLLKCIGDGANSPSALDDAVEAVANEAGSPMTRAFVSTQRSGAIARMADLGLIIRVRNGLAVTYRVAERGRAYSALRRDSLRAQ